LGSWTASNPNSAVSPWGSAKISFRCCDFSNEVPSSLLCEGKIKVMTITATVGVFIFSQADGAEIFIILAITSNPQNMPMSLSFLLAKLVQVYSGHL
jgi:hypothetical protein